MRQLAILAALAAAAGSAHAAELNSAFHILRKGVPIGYHVVDVKETDEGLKVDTRIEMRVKFGPVPVFRYHHQATELWRDGVLQSISSITNDNGEEMSLTGWRENGVLMLDGTAYQGPAPADAAPSSYWNKELLNAALQVNTQNGELTPVEVTRTANSLSPNGEMAEHFVITGTVIVNLWYDGERLVGSHFEVDGQELTYEPVGEDMERQRLLAKLDVVND